jgi:membrane protein DedA with SNARE-associated domain
VRHVTAVVAGASRLSVPTFMAFAYTGAALWASCFLTIGYIAGDRWRGLAANVHRDLLVPCVVVSALACAYVLRKAWRHRRDAPH